MKAIIKRQIKSYLKNPLFWVGILVVFIGVYQLLAPYLTIHYVEKNEKLPTEEGKPWDGAVSYTHLSSGSFNYAPSSKDLEKRVEEDVKAFKERYKEVTGEEFKGEIPADMLTASGLSLIHIYHKREKTSTCAGYSRMV